MFACAFNNAIKGGRLLICYHGRSFEEVQVLELLLQPLKAQHCSAFQVFTHHAHADTIHTSVQRLMLYFN